MEIAEEQGNKTRSSWRRVRWLYMARYAVASVVTVVAVAVIIKAVMLMLRPEKLQLKLAGGHVEVKYIPSLPPPGNVVILGFLLRANNPSGRASVVFANVTVRLAEASLSSSPGRIAEFPLPPIPVPQRMAHEASVVVGLKPEEDLPMRYVRVLYEGRAVASAQMELTGVLTSHVGMTSISVNTTYYCWPVSIAVGAANYAVADVPCFDSKEAPAHV